VKLSEAIRRCRLVMQATKGPQKQYPILEEWVGGWWSEKENGAEVRDGNQRATV
jgi:hypothetical protein